MIESTAFTAAVQPAPSARPARGGVLSAIALCTFRPATAARRTLSFPLRRAFLLHAISAIGIVLAILVVIVWVDSDSDATFRGVWIKLRHTFGSVADDFADNPLPMSLAVVAIELGYAALALLFVAWGARDEPILDSIRHALRRVWMQTPQLLLFVILTGATIAALDRTSRQWDDAHPVEYPQMPVRPAGIRQNTPQWGQYTKDVQAYYDRLNEIRHERLAMQPWYVRGSDAVTGTLSLLLGLGFVGSLLRAVGVARTTQPIERPPRCEACGYDLTLMPMESRCPECGEPIVASLGPDVRPGPPWRDRSRGPLARWATTWTRAAFSPTAFGRTLRLGDPGTSHRRFLLLHLPLVFLIGAAFPPILYHTLEGQFPNRGNPEVFLIVPLTGLMCAFGATAMSLKIAAWAGWYHWWRERRNLLPVAIQATCYLTPLLVTWEFSGGATGILVIWLGQQDGFTHWARGSGMDPHAMLAVGWLALNFIWLGVYATLVKRIVAAARFANT